MNTKYLFLVLLSFSLAYSHHGQANHGIIYNNVCGGVSGSTLPPIDNLLKEWQIPDGSGGYIKVVSWMPLAAMAMFTSGVVIALIYLFGTFTRDPNAPAFAKMESYELISTGVILLIIVGLITNMCSYDLRRFILIGSSNLPASVPADIQDDNSFDVAENYFKQVGAHMEGWMEANYLFAIWLDEAATITPYTRPLGVGMVAAPLAGLASPLKQVIYNVYTALSVAYIINYGQLHVFTFAVVSFVRFYLPIGLFLRAFTPTRRLGGTLLGIGVGFTVLMTLFILLNDLIFLSSAGGLLSLFNTAVLDYMNNHLNLASIAQNFLVSFMDAGIGTIIGGYIGGKWGAMLGFIIGVGGIPGSLLTAAFIIPISTASTAFLIGFIVPAFNTLLVVQAIKSLSATLGEEIDVSSLTRMI